jgi:hypothetical protein
LLSYPFWRVRSALNQVLLDKWLWRLAVEREAFWRLIVDKRFDGGWCTNGVNDAYEASLWKHIRRG